MVPKGRKSDIIKSSIISSYLWPKFKILTLNKNVRFATNKEIDQSMELLANFDKWLLEIGNENSENVNRIANFFSGDSVDEDMKDVIHIHILVN